MNLASTIRGVQSALRIEPDGIAGPKTWAAIHARIIGSTEPLPSSAPVDERSATCIATLHPNVRTYALALLHACAEQGIDARVISGTRSYEAQDTLYAKGRTAPGGIVTNARGGYSNHNFGIAFDIGIFDGRTYLGESPLYKAAGALGRNLGLEWGGDWRSIIDEPHFQFRPAWARVLTERDMLTELRRRHEVGQDAFA